MQPIQVRFPPHTHKKKETNVQWHAARVLIEPLNDARITTVFLTCSVKALISIMQACDSLMGDVGGEAHKYSQSFLNLNFKFFLLYSICRLFKSELHSRHGEWREMKDRTMKEGGESFGWRKRAQWFISLKRMFQFFCVSGACGIHSHLHDFAPINRRRE